MMTMTSNPATDHFDAMELDERWLGYGYLGERRNFIAGAQERGMTQAEAEQIVADADALAWAHALETGMTRDELLGWANSRTGRFYGDAMFGSSDGLAERSRQAGRHGLLPRVIRDY